MSSPLQSVKLVVEEITRIHQSLPRRPEADEVAEAEALVSNADREEEQARADAVSGRQKSPEVPDELFAMLQEVEKSSARFFAREQKREALRMLDLESLHASFGELVQKASKYVPAISVAPERRRISISRDDNFLRRGRPSLDGTGIVGELNVSRGFLLNSKLKLAAPAAAAAAAASGYETDEKLSLAKLASLIEVYAKKRARELSLQGKLMDQVDWIPNSIGKLSGLVTLDLSENRIVALPDMIGVLSSLRKLDLHSNRIVELPGTIWDLVSLMYLDLRGNQLALLPTTIGKLANLVELDISSNRISLLPDSIGNLISLKKLNIETNDIEELPHAIGNCASLVELRADYNRLKGLPEAVGRLASLEILSLRYNNIKGLPTTMASLSNLKELDISFNELESVPESLCLATSLIKLNLGNNFADLQSLPRSIGNLEFLEELDISNNQIRVLPDSFGMLSQLYVLHAEENPFEVPPRHIAQMGAQDVVLYMAELVAKRDIESPPAKIKKTWVQYCFFSRPSKRKHDGHNYVKPSTIKA